MHVKLRSPFAHRLIPIVMLMVGPLQAYAQPAQDQALCAKGTPDQAVSACGRLIPAGAPGMKPELAYYYRARAWVAMRDFDRAIADLTEAIKLNPGFADAYYNRGRVWQDKRDPDRAIADYNEAIRLNPKDGIAYNNRGIAWDMKQDYARAMTDFNDALKLNPKHANAYVNRGNLWQRQREVERAIADYNEAIRLDPRDATAHNNRGYAWQEKRDPDRAIADFNEAIRLNPKYANAYYNRAYALQDKRQHDRALADVNAALQLNPGHLGALNLAARLMAGSPDAKVRNGKRAVELAQKAAELSDWKNGNYIATLAAAHAETGNFAEAVRRQEQALAIPAYEKMRGLDGRERLALYKASKPYREPAK